MLLCISGALREGSYNTQLLRAVGQRWGEDVEFGDIRMPLYDNDLEDLEGVPEAAQRLAQQIQRADAVVLATPEYNQSLSGVLKNALDWVSRVKPSPWTDKPVALVSAAAGRSGGARGSYALRLAMTPFNTRLIAMDVLLADAKNQFDAEGQLTNTVTLDAIGRLVTKLKTECAR